MAELQTDINVKIKLGDEKNSSGESNLPAIDKGSIVITKDTNRIYIDTIDDVPERIEIGENKQDKFANVTNPGICKVTMSNSGQTYFCNNSSDSGIYFDSSIRLLQGKGIKNDDDLVNKKYVDEMLQGKEDSITYKTNLTVGSITTDPDGGGRYISKLENTSLSFSDKIASATLPSMLITPTAHNGTTPAYLTFASPAQNTAVGNANVRLTGIAAPTADNDAVNRGYLTTKYGSTYYESQDKQYYLPSGSNMVIPNTNMGRLFIGSESAASTDFKIYVNDPVDDGKLIITNLKTPTNNEDAANKAYVDTETAKKQGKFADISYENNITTNDKLVLTPNVDNAISEVYFNIDGSSDWKMGTKAVSAPYFKTKNGYIIANTSSMPPILMSNVTTQATTPIINFESDANNNATILRGIANGLNDNDAVNVSQLVKKQDKFATVVDDANFVTVNINNSIELKGGKAGVAPKIIGKYPNFIIQADPNDANATIILASKVYSNKVIDFKEGILVCKTPQSNLEATNKKYVDDIKTELLNAITHPYTYDETTKELTLIL